MGFNGDIKSGRRYTEEFKDYIRGKISDGLSLRDIVQDIGLNNISGSAFDQLYYKLCREVHEGQDIKKLKAKHSGKAYNNVKDAGIKDEGAVYVEETKTSMTVNPQVRSLLHEYSVKAQELNMLINYKTQELDLLNEQLDFYNKICRDLSFRLRSNSNA